MAIVTVDIYNERWEKNIQVTYDNEIINITFDSGNTLITFINGYEININNGQVRFYRDDRGEWYETGILDSNNFISGITITPQERDYVKTFKINLNVMNTLELIIDLTEADLRNLTDYEYIGDVEPEPEPEETTITITDFNNKNWVDWVSNLHLLEYPYEMTLPFTVTVEPNENHEFYGDGTYQGVDGFGTPITSVQNFDLINNSFVIDDDSLDGYELSIIIETKYTEPEEPVEPEPEEPEPEEPETVTITEFEKLSDGWRSNLDTVEFPFTVNTGYEVRFYPDGDKEFTGTHLVSKYDRFGTIIGRIDLETKDNYLSFILNDDIYKLTADLRTIPVDITQVSDFVNVYEITPIQLGLLSNTRFIDYGQWGEVNIVDYGNMIMNLMVIPFEIPEHLIYNNNSQIRLGLLRTGINATLLKSYLLEIDLGTIHVPEKYGNVLDYSETDVELFLPLLNSIPINVDYVIGETIRIEYVIDLYSGNVTVNLYSTFSDSLFHSEIQNIGHTIPFSTSRYDGMNGSLDVAIHNNIKTPYVIVTRNRTIENNELMGVGVIEVGKLLNRTGYFEVSDIDLDSKATNQEQSEIKNILSNGVFING